MNTDSKYKWLFCKYKTHMMKWFILQIIIIDFEKSIDYNSKCIQSESIYYVYV